MSSLKIEKIEKEADAIGIYVDPVIDINEKERLDKLTVEFIKQYKAKEHSKK